MKVFTEFKQYSDQYWMVRRAVPTASEFSRIVTAKTGELASAHKGYIAQLIADRIDPDYLQRYSEDNSYKSAAMRNGTLMEPEARRWYEFATGEQVQQVGFCLTDDGRFGASPDALVGDDGVLELKAPDPHVQVGRFLDGGLPEAYIQQCHGHLIVTGRKWCDWVSYRPGFPQVRVRVYPDEYTDKMRKALEAFWPLYQEAWAKVRETMPEPVALDDEADAMSMFTIK